METLRTTIEFVSSGASKSGTVATGDPLFVVIDILIAILAISALLIYVLHNKATATSAQSSAGTYKTARTNSTKLLVAVICIIVAAACFVAFGHNNAHAGENNLTSGNIASITNKVKANVDDAGKITLEKGVITNNNDVLAIGVRQVTTNSDVDLSDATLKIMCDEEVLFNQAIGNTQTNDEYVAVPIGESADLTYEISIPAEKAKKLVGSSPVTLNTVVDLIVSKSGVVKNASDSPVAGAKVSYSYTDPYDGAKLVTGETTTDSNGEYEIPNIKKGESVKITVTYQDAGGRSYEAEEDVTFDDENDIAQIVVKTEPKADDLKFTAPTGTIVYDGTAKTASFEASATAPYSFDTDQVTPEYKAEGSSEWSKTAPTDAGTYYVRANVAEGTSYAKKDGIEDSSWKFTIEKATITVTPKENQTKVYDGSTATGIEYNNSGAVSGETAAFSGALALKDDAKDFGTPEIVQGTLALADDTASGFKAANYTISFTTGKAYSITAKTLTVTPKENQTKVYDGATASGITYDNSGAVSGETAAFSGALALKDDAKDVGTPEIVQGTLVLADDTSSGFKAANYTISFTTGKTYSITAKTLTVTPKENQTKVYDGSTASGITYDNSGAISGETAAFSGALALKDDAKDFGTPEIVQGTLALADDTASGFKAANYTISFTTGKTYSITPKTLTVTPKENQTKVYDGATASGITYDNSGAVSGETAAFSGALALKDDAKDVGTPEIVQGTLALADDASSGFKAANYTISFTTGKTYSITPKTLTVTPKENQTKVYDGATASGITYDNSGAVSGETAAFSGALALKDDAKDVGTPEIVQGTLALADDTASRFKAANYTISFTTGKTYSITAKTLTVTPNDGQTKTYDGVSPTSDLTYTSTGAVFGETPAFSGALALAGDAKNVGTHEIVQGSLALANNEGSGFKAANYTISFTTGKTYSITKAENPMTFNLTTTSGTSSYSETADASQKIEAASNAPTSQGDTVSYSITNLTGTGSFEISTDESGNPSVVCKAGTAIGTYNLVVLATSGGTNYESKTLPESTTTSNFTWTVEKAVSYKSIQSTVGDTTTVNFLPAYSGDSCPYKFYTKSDGKYTEIKDIGNMADLASKICAAGAKNVYTDATDATFYGTIDITWNDAFNPPEINQGTAVGLRSTFAAALNTAGVKMVYFANNDDTEASSVGNWDYHDNNEPTLGGVNFSSFCNAYSSFLSEEIWCAWSSRSSGAAEAMAWEYAEGCWQAGFKSANGAVVLLKKF